jgi:hypothetical protein
MEGLHDGIPIQWSDVQGRLSSLRCARAPFARRHLSLLRLRLGAAGFRTRAAGVRRAADGLADATLSGSAEEGFVLTPERLCWKGSWTEPRMDDPGKVVSAGRSPCAPESLR